MTSTFDSTRQSTDWIKILRAKVSSSGSDPLYHFLSDDVTPPGCLTYAQLDEQARVIAVGLQKFCSPGDRALLLYPPGLEFIAGLFGCWYAGLIAVPAYPPRSAKHASAFSTLAVIANDAQPAVVLTVSRLLPSLQSGIGRLPALVSSPLVATDEPASSTETWMPPKTDGQTLACLQYTSGSTSSPKGVMLTHANLLAGSATIKEAFGHSSASRGVIWLPPYHDMGLIGGILQPLYAGFPVTLMAAASFLQRPIRWLETISRVRGTTSGGPNFAYELCLKAVSDADRKTLDLSCWDVAFNGAESINPITMQRFAEAFAPCRFKWESFYPCYGLAEATLLLSGGEKSATPVVRSYRSANIAMNEALPADAADEHTISLAGCGTPRPRGSVRVVDPQSGMICPDRRIGEIWATGDMIGRGYWRQPEQTQATFAAHTTDTREGPFLRTGDLGFLDDGELFITGRLKDVIIVRGRNYYPQDIEQTAQHSHSALRPGHGAAFSTIRGGVERLVIVQELERTQRHIASQSVIDAVRQAIANEHELSVWAIVLLQPGQILKTSSGKIRRRACREAFLNDIFEAVAKWEQPVEPPPVAVPVPVAAPSPPPDAGQIEELIVASLATALNIPADEIEPGEPFARYGLDSAGAVGLAGTLETVLGTAMPATLFYDYPSPRDLSRHLAGEVKS